MNICEITSQVTRNLNEIELGLNVQILEVMNSAITKTVLPSTKSTPGAQGTWSNAKLDLLGVTRAPKWNITENHRVIALKWIQIVVIEVAIKVRVL